MPAVPFGRTLKGFAITLFIASDQKQQSTASFLSVYRSSLFERCIAYPNFTEFAYNCSEMYDPRYVMDNGTFLL